jgi:hypothetical protein
MAFASALVREVLIDLDILADRAGTVAAIPSSWSGSGTG